MRLLLAEDDLDLAEALTALLKKNQFIVDSVNDGSAAYDYASTGNYDALILDVMMPKLNGIQVLKKLRSDGCHTPIMMLTAKAEKDDRVLGFDAGADDYLPKPFAPDELLSRIRAILRRGATNYTPSTLSYGDLLLDGACGELSCGNNTTRLSGKEFQVMELFMRNPHTIFPADRIMDRIWGWEAETEINVVWVHISNLRKKIKAIGSSCSLRVSRGLGYSLEENHD